MTIIGIDVSKAKLDCAWIRDLAAMKIKTKVHKNTPAGYDTLLTWAMQHTGEAASELQFVMEATGVYHEPLAYALHAAGAQVAVVNPARVRDYAKSLGTQTKTDKKDSVMIAHFGLQQALRPWEPEPLEVRELKALIARLDAVKHDIQRERNRLEKAQAGLSSVAVTTSIETVLAQLEAEKARLVSLIDDHIDGHPGLKNDLDLLESIPAVGPVVGQQMVAVLRSRAFTAATQAAAFMGVVPIESESGTSVKRPPRLSKRGDSRIRAKLYMAAVVATKHNPDIRALYLRLLKKGKSKMSAIGAAMRKLVHICFGVLKHQTPYQPQTGLQAC